MANDENAKLKIQLTELNATRAQDQEQAARTAALALEGRGLRSFPIQLNLSSSVHRMARLSS